MKRQFVSVILVLLITFTFSIPILAFEPVDDYEYYRTQDIYMIEPMIDGDVKILSEAIDITHFTPSLELKTWTTIEKPSLVYDATIVLQNDDPLKTIDVVVPYYGEYQNNLHDVVSVKLDGVKQNPAVNLGEIRPDTIAFLDYTADYSTSISMENHANPVVGYLYELEAKNPMQQGYVEFQYNPLSTRLFSEFDINELNYHSGGYHEMRYYLMNGHASLLSADRELVWTVEENVTSTVRTIHLDEFYEMVFDTHDYTFAQSILLGIMEQENYDQLFYSFDNLQSLVRNKKNVMFYHYEIPAPQGTSELTITYKQSYDYILLNQSDPIFLTIVTSPLKDHPSDWPYQVTYTIDEPYDVFVSEDFARIPGDEVGRYRCEGETIPSHNLSFLVFYESEDPVEDVGDSYILLLGIGIIMIPVVLFVGILIFVIIVITRKNKKKN